MAFNLLVSICTATATATTMASPASWPAATGKEQAPVGSTTVPRSDPIFGVGLHPGNYLGPLAFEVILRPVRHVALNVQAWTEDLSTRRIAVAPEIQWEVQTGPSTPYVGLLFRYERDAAEAQQASSRGGGMTAGWQWRWPSGLGL